MSFYSRMFGHGRRCTCKLPGTLGRSWRRGTCSSCWAVSFVHGRNESLTPGSCLTAFRCTSHNEGRMYACVDTTVSRRAWW